MAAYGSDAAFAEWLAANGLVLPEGAPLPAVLREIGSSYVDGAYEARLFCSKRTGGFTQELAWPRTGQQLNGEPIPDDLIPLQWVYASYRAAYLQASQGGWAQGGVDPNRLTKREKVDVIEREFFGVGEGAAQGNAAAGFNVDPMIDGWVSRWLCDQAGESGIGFWAIGS